MFTIIDIETTGTVYKYGRITEIAVYVHNGESVTASFSTLVNPEMDIPLPVSRITGITNAMVAGAPRFFEIARDLAEITAGKTFVAHNARFDYGFIREEYQRLGYDFQRKTLCTVQLSRKLLPGHASYSLGNLCADLGIDIHDRHRAAGDALATVRLFEILLEKNKEIRMTSAPGKNGALF